jgi:argininosuccinate synthase
MKTRGRYAHQITTGMWVKTWAGDFRQVEGDPRSDLTGFVTIRFTNGTAIAVLRHEILTTHEGES